MENFQFVRYDVGMQTLGDLLKSRKDVFVKDIKDKDQVMSSFLVKFAVTQTGKTGKPYMNLVLMDSTGEIEARVWEDVPKHSGQLVQDCYVWIEGKCQLFQGRRQLVVKSAQILREDQIDPVNYMKPSPVNASKRYDELLGYVASMKDPFYKALAESILKEDAEIQEKLMKAPAAKSMHHAYPAGLIDHVVSITGILDALSKHYGDVLDRDLLFLGGFLHDIGKIWELSYEKTTDYTDEGRLIGHLVMGVELVNKKIQELENSPGRLPGKFPQEKALLVKHVILAHHGKLEYGSPKRPKCLEALIVHYIDDLDSKVNAIQTFIEDDEGSGLWTGLSRSYERFFFKPEWARKGSEPK